MERPRLLFIAPICPSPGANGLAMRSWLFLSAYARVFEVDLLVLPLVGEAAIAPAAARIAARSQAVTLGPVNTHFALVRSVADPAARLAAFERYGAPALTARLSPAVHASVAAFIGERRYATLHVARLYLGEFAAACPARLKVLDADECDGATMRSLARLARGRGKGPEAAGLVLEARHLDDLARRSLPGFDLVFTASQPEARSLARLSATSRTAVVPNPAPLLPPTPRRKAMSCVQTLLFVGTLGYAPNIDGVGWFVRSILPSLQRRLGGRLRFQIVGRAPSPAVRRLAGRHGVTVTGDAEALAPFYQTADLVIAPLRAGGGTRLKLLEAIAHRRCCVATRLAADGLPLRSGRDLMLTDGAAGFAAACAMLLRKRALRERLVQHAALAIAHENDPRRLADRIVSLVTDRLPA